MGTRADFYIKRVDEEPVEHNSPIEWIASIAWDGYPSGIDCDVLQAQHYHEYQTRLEGFLLHRDDVTYPKDGWPWPWETSATTDFAYLFDCNLGKVLVWYKTKQWYSVSRHKHEDFYADEVDDLVIEATYTLPIFNIDDAAFGGPRSGLIIIGR